MFRPFHCLIVAFVALFASSAVTARPPASKYFDDEGVRALAEAGAKGDVRKITKLVKEKGVNVNAVGKDGFTPLAYAMLSLSKTGFAALLEAGADPNAVIPGLPDGGASMVGLAAQATEVYWLKKLAEHGANLNVRTTYWGQPPIVFAIEHHRIENIRFLLSKKVDLTIKDVSGYTPVFSAAVQDCWDGVLILLEEGAEWDVTLPRTGRLVDRAQRYEENLSMDRTSFIWRDFIRVLAWLEQHGEKLPPELAKELAKNK
jgi:ankyrin repeat protein